MAIQVSGQDSSDQMEEEGCKCGDIAKLKYEHRWKRTEKAMPKHTTMTRINSHLLLCTGNNSKSYLKNIKIFYKGFTQRYTRKSSFAVFLKASVPMDGTCYYL